VRFVQKKDITEVRFILPQLCIGSRQGAGHNYIQQGGAASGLRISSVVARWGRRIEEDAPAKLRCCRPQHHRLSSSTPTACSPQPRHTSSPTPTPTSPPPRWGVAGGPPLRLGQGGSYCRCCRWPQLHRWREGGGGAGAGGGGGDPQPRAAGAPTQQPTCGRRRSVAGTPPGAHPAANAKAVVLRGPLVEPDTGKGRRGGEVVACAGEDRERRRRHCIRRHRGRVRDPTWRTRGGAHDAGGDIGGCRCGWVGRKRVLEPAGRSHDGV
jgi:hypothetical protein